MIKTFSKLLDWLSGSLANRKGLLPILGLLMVIFNFILKISMAGWFASTDFFLHLGVILAIIGFMVAWAL
jgi:hypothetical protein